MLREFAAAVWLVQHHAPAAVDFRISSDKAGTLRCQMGKLEGITASELAAALGQVEAQGLTHRG